MEKIRLLITTGIFPPEIGGPATYVHSLSNWLCEQKHDVTVLTSSQTDLTEKFSFHVETIKRKGSVLWHLKAFMKIFKLLKSADILYANGLFLESSVSALFRKKKIVFRIPGDQIWERAVRKKWTEKQFMGFQNEKGCITIGLLRWIRKMVLNHAGKIIAPSAFLADVIETWGVKNAKIEVIYNPYSKVNERKYEFPFEFKGKFIITTGGRLVSWKGVDSVIHAIKKIDNGFLVVLGDGPERNNLENLVRNLGLSKRVFFSGNINRSEMTYLFLKSDCFVLNSFYEGLPQIILEAMAAGCPVIASNTGGIPEVIQNNENGLLFEPGDKPDLIASITRIKNNAGLTKQLTDNGRRTINEKFHIDRSFQKTISILKQCIND